MLRALIFDVDGTLADTESVHLEAFNHAFAEEGLDWRWDEVLYQRLLRVSGGQERMRHYWQTRQPGITELQAGAVNQTLQRLHEVKTAHYEAAVNAGRVALRPGVLELIEEARRARLALAIATTTSPVNVAALLRRALGPDWRTHFVAVGDASTAPLKKPHPQVYLRVLADLGLPAGDCIAFEDSLNGLRAAQAAGLATVVTPTRFTAHERFDGALRVLADLRGVGLASLRRWQAPAPAAA